MSIPYPEKTFSETSAQILFAVEILKEPFFFAYKYI